MASTAHGTLVANVVSTVTVFSGQRGVVVVNRTLDGGAIWARIDGIAPTVAGADSYVVLGAREFPLRDRYYDVTVKLLSATARDFTVEAMN